jgi:KipI family sensor histidine kinase inhibitor
VIALDPLGDRAFLARFDSMSEARSWSAKAKGLAGVADVVLAYANVGVFADERCEDLDALAEALESCLASSSDAALGRLVTIPVLYDGEDLSAVAGRLGLGVDQVVSIHSGREYDVLAMGFLPGFPYAGDLDPRLANLPRRDSPRARVQAGSVAIAGKQTGIYPAESPGGWHLLGRTPLKIVDAGRGHFPIRTGDRLRFVPIGLDEYQARRGEWLDVST